MPKKIIYDFPVEETKRHVGKAVQTIVGIVQEKNIDPNNLIIQILENHTEIPHQAAEAWMQPELKNQFPQLQMCTELSSSYIPKPVISPHDAVLDVVAQYARRGTVDMSTYWPHYTAFSLNISCHMIDNINPWESDFTDNLPEHFIQTHKNNTAVQKVEELCPFLFGKGKKPKLSWSQMNAYGLLVRNLGMLDEIHQLSGPLELINGLNHGIGRDRVVEKEEGGRDSIQPNLFEMLLATGRDVIVVLQTPRNENNPDREYLNRGSGTSTRKRHMRNFDAVVEGLTSFQREHYHGCVVLQTDSLINTWFVPGEKISDRRFKSRREVGHVYKGHNITEKLLRNVDKCQI